MRSKILGLLLIVGIAFVGQGCTRKKQENQSNLSVPLTGALSRAASVGNFEPRMIFVNVSAPGMPPRFWRWEAPENGMSVLPPPVAVVNDVPRGNDRLIQILAVGESDTEGMDFFYGDLKVSLTKSEEYASVILTSMGSAGIEGQVAGRRIDGVDGLGDFGPTGNVVMQFHPLVAGRPPMELFRSSVINGWFNFFFITGANFSYRIMGSGVPFFDQKNINSPEFVPTTQQNLSRLKIPPRYRVRDPGNPVYEAEPGVRVTFGFWGVGAGSKKACYPNNTSNINNWFTTAAPTPVVGWDGTNPANVLASEAGPEGGGLAVASLNNCEASAASKIGPNHYYIDPDVLSYSGKDEMVGFVGPFAIPTTPPAYGGLINRTDSGGNATLSWNALPGASDVIDGVAVFARSNSAGGGGDDGLYGGPEGLNCQHLPMKGFVEIDDIDLSAGSAVVNLNGMNNPTLVLCPYVDNFFFFGREYLFSAATVARGNYMGGGGGSNVTQLALVAPLANFNEDACVPFILEPRDSTNKPVGWNGTAVNLSLSPSGPFSASLYESSDCSGSPSGPSIPLWGPRVLYAKTTGTYTGGQTLSISANAAGVSPGNLMMNRTPAAAANTIQMFGPSDIVAHRCIPYLVVATNGTSVAKPSAAFSAMMYVNGSFSGTFYSDGACQTTLGSSLGFTSNESGKFAHFLNSSTTAASGLPMSSAIYANVSAPFSSTGGITLNTHIIPGPPHSLQLIDFYDTMTVNQCYQGRVRVYDAAGNVTSSGGGFVASLNPDVALGMNFYSDFNCTSGVGPSATLAPSTTYTTFYFKPTAAAASKNFSVSASGLTSGSRVVHATIQPPTLALTSYFPPTFIYPNTQAGMTNDQMFMLKNIGSSDATVSTVTVGSSDFSINSQDCTTMSPLVPGEVCYVTVRFQPPTPNSYSDMLSVAHSGGTFTQSLMGMGTGSPAVLSISNGPTYDYGSQTAGSYDFTFTITNSGAQSATSMMGSGLFSPYEFKGGSYPGVGGTCGTSLAPAGTCTVVVTFSPVGPGGPYFDDVEIHYNDGSMMQMATRQVQGSGI